MMPVLYEMEEALTTRSPSSDNLSLLLQYIFRWRIPKSQNRVGVNLKILNHESDEFRQDSRPKPHWSSIEYSTNVSVLLFNTGVTTQNIRPEEGRNAIYNLAKTGKGRVRAIRPF